MNSKGVQMKYTTILQKTPGYIYIIRITYALYQKYKVLRAIVAHSTYMLYLAKLFLSVIHTFHAQ